MKKHLFLILLLLSLTVMTAEAQRKAGRNGAAFLEIGVGAREVGLGSAVTALANDANQIFWNPAGLALADGQKLSTAFSYGSWFADLTYTAAAFAYNLDQYGTIGVGVQVFGVSDIVANRQNGYDDPILQGLVTDTETSGTYDFTDLAVSVSYSRYFFDRLTLGTTFKVVNESIDGVSANELAFYFGSVYRVGLAGWQIAARLNNLGTSMTYFNQDNPLPLTFAIGTSFYPVNTEQTRVMLTVDTTKPIDSRQLIYGGGEVSFYDLLFLRGGYKFNYSGVDDGGTSEREGIKDTIEGFSVGGGLQYEIANYGVAIDYAFTQMDLVENVHRFTLRIGR